MIDESMDTEQMKGEPQPWEFRSKTAWQRLIIMLGGVTVNFVLGIVIFIGIFLMWGDSYIPNASVKDGIAVEELGRTLGLKNGDKIISIGDKPFTVFESVAIVKAIAIDDAKTIVVERDGSTINVPVPDDMASKLTTQKSASKTLITPRFPFEVAVIAKGSDAEKAGLKLKDRIVKINNNSTPFYNDIMKEIQPFKGKDMPITVLRDGSMVDLTVPLSEHGKFGIQTNAPISFFEVENKTFTVGEAIPAGYNKAVGFLTDQIKAFGQMFKGKISAKENLGSFITIGKQFGTTWEWRRFWNMTAMLSMILAFINLLPIPALDGGHVMFLLFESITGIKPSDKFLEYATTAGFFLLIILMVYALGLDISRLF